MDIVKRLRQPINEKKDYFLSQWPNEDAHVLDAVRFKGADEIERLREALEEIMYYDVAWHSEEVGTVDGPCAALARSALQQKESE